MIDPKAELESLVAHPGWRAFQQHVAHEWGPSGVQYVGELERVLNGTDNDAAASQARQILSARKVIERLMAWPAEELARLKRSSATMNEPSFSRRGGL